MQRLKEDNFKIIFSSRYVFLNLFVRLSCLALIIVFFSLASVQEVKATDKTAGEALNYISTLVSTKVGSGQCVALIQEYYRFLGVSTVSGNACDYATNSLPAGWTRNAGGVPQAGDILVYTGATYGHVVIYAGGTTVYQQNWNGLYVEKTTNWNYNKSWYSNNEHGTKSYWGYIRPNFNDIPPDPTNDFVFHLDLPAGSYSGSNNIEVSGWLASKKDISYAFYQIENVVQVQMGLQDEQGVKDANPGYAYGKRFRGVIEIGKLSSNTTYTLGIWLGFADGSQTGVQTSTFSTGTISHETPTGYNLQVTDQSTTGYTISCNFNGTIKEIRFATWTDQNGQDDIKWLNGTISGNTVSCRINTSDHNNEKNCVYWTHIYAYDSNDNPYFLEGTGVNIETTPPVIKNIAVAGDQDGYTVTCEVSDAGSGIDRVQFPTWTTANGQDDLLDGWGNSPAASGIINNGKVTFRVNRSDHNNEWGQYVTHIYAYDKCGNYTSEGTSLLMENTPPKITNVQVTADAEGYTVTCDVSDAGSGVDRVQFPTWTLANGQDDIQQGWNTSTKVRGSLSNGKAAFRVNRSDHNNEYGTYRTHIYCFDKCQNYTYYHVPDIKYEYTIRFDANGGENIPENMKKYLGTDLLLPDTVPVRPGYIFTGYGTSAEGEAEYQPGDLITADEDITLYALWCLVEPDGILPGGLSEIGEEAFAGCGFAYVVIPEGTTTIQNRAFQNCPNLKIIQIPESVANIASDAFDGVLEGLTVFGDDGSYAEYYANKHGFLFESIID